LAFMFVEALYGVWTNSLGLISDACHMLFDCVALAIGLYASVIAKWEANALYSYGYGRVEVLSGFVNGIFLIFIAFMVLKESLERFFHPQEINTDKLLFVSFLGLCVNLVGIFVFHDVHDVGGSHSHGHSHGHSHSLSFEKTYKESRKDSNVYGVYLHIVADTLGSIGVIISSFLIQMFGWTSADPICSFFISIMIFVGVIPLIVSSSSTLLQCTPNDFEKKLAKCLKKMSRMEGVISYRNPHFWKLNKDTLVGTIDVQINEDSSERKILSQIISIFKKKGVKYLTVEVTKEHELFQQRQENQTEEN